MLADAVAFVVDVIYLFDVFVNAATAAVVVINTSCGF